MKSVDTPAGAAQPIPVRHRRRLAIIFIALAAMNGGTTVLYGDYAEWPLAALLLAAFSAGLAGETSLAVARATGRWWPWAALAGANAAALLAVAPDAAQGVLGLFR